jgi:ferredoxin
MNKVDIYYFSGTGNSLFAASEIAKKTEGKLISIPSVVNQENIATDANTIGIVFPVHYIWNGGVPIIVEKFVGKLINISTKYIFAVCTCGGGQGDTIIRLNRMVIKRGGQISAGFCLVLPYNYTSYFGSLAKISDDRKENLFAGCRIKLKEITEHANARKERKIEQDSEWILRIVDLFDLRIKLGKPHYQKKAGFLKSTALPFSEILPLMDKSFYCDGSCNGCGICSKVCPVGNILMLSEKPSWQHHCEQCFACLQWCPTSAIQFGNKTKGGKRYHHPEVMISDMIRQKELSSTQRHK